MTIILGGYYYNNNFGDVLLAKVFCVELKCKFPDAVILLPFCPPVVAKQIGGRSANLIGLLTGRPNVLVYAGGGYLGDNGHHPLSKRGLRWALDVVKYIILPWCIVYSRSGIIEMIGVGAGTIRNPIIRFWRNFAARTANKIIVRDSVSLVELSRYSIPKAELGADPAVLWKTNRRPALGDPPLVGIHLYSEPSEDSCILPAASVVCLALKNNLPNCEIVLLADNPKSRFRQDALSAIFKAAGFTVRAENYENVESFVDLLASLSLVITSKLHVGVVALAHGAKVVPLFGHPKIRSFYAEISHLPAAVAICDTEQISNAVINCLASARSGIPPEYVTAANVTLATAGASVQP